MPSFGKIPPPRAPRLPPRWMYEPFWADHPSACPSAGTRRRPPTKGHTVVLPPEPPRGHQGHTADGIPPRRTEGGARSLGPRARTSLASDTGRRGRRGGIRSPRRGSGRCSHAPQPRPVPRLPGRANRSTNHVFLRPRLPHTLLGATFGHFHRPTPFALLAPSHRHGGRSSPSASATLTNPCGDLFPW